MQPILRAEGLEKTYHTGSEELTIFADLRLSVERGERLALVGESGAGKSTLLYLLGGLDLPSSGRVWFEDTAVFPNSETALADYRNRRVGFVWQIHHLLPEFSALENVMMPLLIRGVHRSQAAWEAMDSLSQVNLAPRARHRPGELSGGERQRVVLARALVGKPALLLADEPTGNLDQQTGESVFALIGELHRRLGLTSILVTHNLGFAARCDRVLRLQSGRLTPENLTLHS